MAQNSAASPHAQPTRMEKFRRALTPEEWARLGGVGAAILGLHIVGWVTLIWIVAPADLSAGGKAFGIGVGITAYVLGMRHAFDADHIAVIDNTTRKLMGDGQRPLTVGFWFSLGHSSIVFGLAFLLAVGVKALAGQVTDDASGLHQFTSVWGTLASAGFLYLIAALNIVALLGIISVFRKMRRGQFSEAELEKKLGERGFIARLLRPIMRSVTKPWQMYLVGLVMGFGFDTATEVALLFLAATGAAGGLPWYAILCMPVLFAAGMTLFDTLDGAFMSVAYQWAFSRPIRKVYYNLTMTSLTVAVAVLIGTFEVLGILAEKLDLSGGVWEVARVLDLNWLGFAIVGVFVVIWACSLAVWKWGRVEKRWGEGS